MATAADALAVPSERQIAKSDTRAKPRESLVINVGSCRYAVVRSAATALGWAAQEDEDEFGWSVSFRDTSVSSTRVLRLEPHQRINHFLGMHVLCRKAEMARTLNRMRAAFGDRYAIAPASWILPEERPALEATLASASRGRPRTLIVKPSVGCQGKGIFLTRSTDDLPSDERSVVQEYVDRPLLIDGYKFDLRVYVVVLSVAPMRVYLFDDGLVRLCSQKYRAPTIKNMRKSRMHLTNYAINKAPRQRSGGASGATAAASAARSAVDGEELGETGAEQEGDDGTPTPIAAACAEDVGGIPGEGTGVKRSIHWLMRWLHDHGHDASALWAGIADLSALALMAAQPQLAHSYRSAMASNGGSTAPTRQCFEILGLDVMVDSRMRPWLLEVNHSPSFTCDAAIDWRIKHALLTETLHILCLRAGDERRKAKQASQAAKSRLYGAATTATSSRATTKKEPEESRYRRLESNRKCMLWRILPKPGSEEGDVLDGKLQLNKRLSSFRRYAAKRAGVLHDTARSGSHAASARASRLPHSEYPIDLPWGGTREFWESHIESWQLQYSRLAERYPEFVKRARSEAEGAADTPRSRPATALHRTTTVPAAAADTKRVLPSESKPASRASSSSSSSCGGSSGLSSKAVAEARAAQVEAASRLSRGQRAVAVSSSQSSEYRQSRDQVSVSRAVTSSVSSSPRQSHRAARAHRPSAGRVSSASQAHAAYSTFRMVEPSKRGGTTVRDVGAPGSAVRAAPSGRPRAGQGIAVVRLGSAMSNRAPATAAPTSSATQYVALRRADPDDDVFGWSQASTTASMAHSGASRGQAQTGMVGAIALGQVRWASRAGQTDNASRGGGSGSSGGAARSTLRGAGSRVLDRPSSLGLDARGMPYNLPRRRL